jgi:hypothetical protein
MCYSLHRDMGLQLLSFCTACTDVSRRNKLERATISSSFKIPPNSAFIIIIIMRIEFWCENDLLEDQEGDVSKH